MCPFVSADVRGGGRLRDEPKECLRRRLSGTRGQNVQEHLSGSKTGGGDKNSASYCSFKKNCLRLLKQTLALDQVFYETKARD